MTLDRVVFRKFANRNGAEGPGGEVIAWLPDVEANPGRCMSYMHIGQHGEGVYPAATVPASVHEFRPLLFELERIGYNLRVVSRLTRKG